MSTVSIDESKPATGLPPTARIVVAAAWASNIGDGIRLVALPLLTATLTDRAALIGAVGAASMLPGAVLGAPIGVVIDRVDRRRVALIADLARVLVAITVTILVATNTVTIAAVFAAAVCLGIGETFRDLVGAALVADAVADGDLEAANGGLIAAEAAGNTMLGPFGGSLLWTVASPLPFLTDALALSVSAAMTAKLSRTTSPTAQPEGVAPRRLLSELGGAWAMVTRHRLLRRMACVSFLVQFGLVAVNAVEVIWARDRLGIGAIGFGLLNATMASGAIVASLRASRLTDRLPARAVIPTMFAVSAICPVVYAASTFVPLVFAMAFVGGMSLSLGDVALRAARVRAAGADHVGRVSGVLRTVLWTGGIVGALAGGVCTDLFGLVATFRLAAALLTVAALSAWRWSPVVVSPPT